jgi:UDP-N-acetylmuramoylalanine--D-glutamate ligase
MKDLRGKRVLVVGLARSGYAVALCLRQHGAMVTVTDIRPPHAFQAILPELTAQKIGLELGSQDAQTFLRHDLVVISPGVPWDLPQLSAARERGIPVVPEVEAASWFLEGTLVGVTGSNGKTTTASLLGKILEASGFPTFVGGNIGVPLSTAVDRVPAGSFLVTELSSFQLEAIQELRPHVAIFLNLSPNHLDRHPSMEAYAQAKRQIFRNQQADDYAILNLDDPAVAALAPALAGRKVFFSRCRPLPEGVLVSDGQVIYRVGHLERVLFATRDVGLRGDFNLENVLAAAAAACVLGADFDAVRSALREFRGVEHRLEFVRAIEGVEFYNNSKATSVDAAVKSLEAFERGVHLILGGKDKGAPYAPLRPLLRQRVREVLLIGEAAERIAKELSGAAELLPAGDLATAVREAFRRAGFGDTVLLAPACSSFDQFQDFEHRGRVFKELVNDLAREVEEKQVSGSGNQVSAKSQTEPSAPAGPPCGLPERSDSAHSSTSAGGPERSRRELVEEQAGPEPPRVVESRGSRSERDGGPSPAEGLPEERPGDGTLRPAGGPLNLLYVYEVGAEELPPADLEFPQQFVEEVRPEAPGDSEALEATEDELLPFETRRGATAAVGAEQGGDLSASGSAPGEALSGQKRGEAGPREAKSDSRDAGAGILPAGRSVPSPGRSSGNPSAREGPPPEGSPCSKAKASAGRSARRQARPPGTE